VPVVLFNQFKYFFNLFFLLIALSQIIPALRVGFMISFVAPLVFVLSVTMIKEFYDDNSRRKKDNEINSTTFLCLDLMGGKFRKVQSKKLRVGDLVVLHPNERAPADMLLLWTSDESGSVFIRTD
jgi:phospholipid-translocating ATPase